MKYFFILLVFLAAFVNAEAGEPRPKRLLVVTSFHLSHPWTKRVNAGIDSLLMDGTKNFTVDYLELNAMRDRFGGYEEKFNAYLPRIQRGDYDAMVALLDDAIELTLKNYDKIPSEMPLILCGDYGFVAGEPNPAKNIITYGSHYELAKTIDLAYEIYPDTTDIVIITDDYRSGRKAHAEAQEIVANFTRGKITLISGSAYNTNQMLDAVSRMPPTTVVLFAPWRIFMQDGYSSLEQVSDELRKHAGKPFFIFTDVLFGHGALGGYVSSGEALGKEVASTVEQLFNGTPLSKIIRYQSMPNRLVFDLREMRLAGIDTKKLPEDARLLNPPATFLDRHQGILVYGGLAAIVFAVLLNIWMYYADSGEKKLLRRRLEAANLEIRKSSNIRDALFQSGVGGILLTDSNWHVVSCNPQALELLCVSREKILGLPLADVLKLTDHETHLPVEIPEQGSSLADFKLDDGAVRTYKINASTIKNERFEAAGMLVCFSDMTDSLLRHSQQYENLSALKSAVEMAKISYVETTLSGKVLRSPVEDCRNWLYRNGKPVAASEWVYSEDIDSFNHEWRRLAAGVTDSVDIKYRAMGHGKPACYTMKVRRLPDMRYMEEPVFGCMITETTCYEEEIHALSAENQLLERCIENDAGALEVKSLTINTDTALSTVNSVRLSAAQNLK